MDNSSRWFWLTTAVFIVIGFVLFIKGLIERKKDKNKKEDKTDKKEKTAFLLSFLSFLVAVFFGIYPYVGDIIPPEPTPTPSVTIPPTPSQTPGPNDIDGSIKSIAYPSKYLPEYKTMYVNADGGHSVYIYYLAAKTRAESTQIGTVWHGTEVTVIAEEKGCSCIVYYDSENRKIAAWVGSEHLTENPPQT